MQLVVVSYLICAAAFLLMTVLVLLSAGRTRHKWLLGSACGATAVWAAMAAWAESMGGASWPISALEILRNLVWLAFVADLLGLSGSEGPNRRVRWAWIAAGIALAVGALAAQLIEAVPLPGVDLGAYAAQLSGFARLAFPLAGLVLLENLFRNADQDSRWALKFLCFGLGAVFAYDFYLYADALLFKRIDETLHQARGAVDALSVPLIAVAVSRSSAWSVGIHVSRQIVFHSATFLGAGLYLLVMAAAGLYLREVGGSWGPTFQVVFLSGAVLILAVIFSSGAIRARVKVFISKNFFSYKYDYRQEWLRFIHTISTDDTGVGLNWRILRAVANIVDSPAGALWILQAEDDAYFPAAVWNLGDDLASVRADSDVVGFLARRQWIVNLPELATRADLYDGLGLPDWLERLPRAWLIVPLIHGETVLAFLVLAKPRAERSLNWEDYDLLKTVGRQTASYLAEEEAARALADARLLEAFNRRFAFVAHDVKNLTSQLSLMLKNAERYGDNPEFRRDMFATITNSVTRMRGMLEQLNAEKSRAIEDMSDNDGAEEPPPGAPLEPLVRRLAADWLKQKDDIAIDLLGAESRPLTEILVDEGRFTSVLNHLLQNAIEAAGTEGTVRLGLRMAEDEAVLEVEDDGPGMDAEFIENHLFRPLDTTKGSGYGIGAYQAREMVREMGGRLEVKSAPGAGATMRVILPTARQDRQAARPQSTGKAADR